MVCGDIARANPLAGFCATITVGAVGEVVMGLLSRALESVCVNEDEDGADHEAGRKAQEGGDHSFTHANALVRLSLHRRGASGRIWMRQARAQPCGRIRLGGNGLVITGPVQR